MHWIEVFLYRKPFEQFKGLHHISIHSTLKDELHKLFMPRSKSELREKLHRWGWQPRMTERAQHVFSFFLCVGNSRKFSCEFSSSLRWKYVNKENYSRERNTTNKSFLSSENFPLFFSSRTSSLIIHFERFNRHQHPREEIFSVISGPRISVVTSCGTGRTENSDISSEKPGGKLLDCIKHLKNLQDCKKSKKVKFSLSTFSKNIF